MTTFAPSSCIYLSIFCIAFSFVDADGSSTLQLVQILFRHGDRTPSNTFPTDPHRYYWKEGREMLTKLGELQQFRLGQYLRQRYKDFLPLHYHYNYTEVRSTDNDRAILSVQSQLLGLYHSPVKTNVSNGRFPLPQLIPIHTVPKRHDQTLKMTSPCPVYKSLWLKMQETEIWRDLKKKYRPFFDDLKRWTGLKHVGLRKAFQIADPVHTWVCHNLTLPGWLTPEVLKKLYVLKNNKQWLRYYTREMQRLRGGPLVKVMIENMKGKLDGTDLQRRRLWYSYSAHDSTVAAVSRYLGVYNRIEPPYCACFIMELHKRAAPKNAPNKAIHTVRLFYRNDSSHDPWKLTIPGCEFDCPLEKFILLSSSNLPGNITRECFDFNSVASFHWPILAQQHPWLLISLLVILLFAILFYVIRRRLKKKKQNNVNHLKKRDHSKVKYSLVKNSE